MGLFDLTFAWDEFGYLVADSVAIALGVVLLVMDPRGRASRIFGAYLLMRGIGDAAVSLGRMTDAGVDEWAWNVGSTVPIAASGFLLVAFLSVYPRARGPLGKHRWAMAAWFGLFVAVALAYIIAPGTSYGRIVHPDYLGTSDPGPLFGFLYFAVLMEGVAAVVLLWDHARSRSNVQRRVLFLLAVGFSAVTAFQGATWLGLLPFFLEGARTPFFWYDVTLISLLVPMAIIVFERFGQALVRRRAGRGAAVAAIVVVGVSGMLGWISGYWGYFWQIAFVLPWLVLPLTASLALLRYSLFDVELRIRWTIKQSTLAGMFVAVFFILSEGTQQLIGDIRGNEYIGIAGAGGLLFVLAPLQRFADKLATRAVPDAKPVTDMGPKERLALYRDQVELAWHDGMIGVKERMILRNLRDRLGIDLREADHIEDEVTAGAGTLRRAPSAA